MTTHDQSTGWRRSAHAAGHQHSRRHFWRPRPAAASHAWLRVFRRAMACRVEILLPAAAAPHVEAARAALDQADRLEQAWSVFRPDSDLSVINRLAAERPCAIDDELRALLLRCDRLCADTDGAFDVTATPLSRCWRLLERQGRLPAPEAIAEARARTGRGLVAIEPGSPDGSGRAPGWTIRFLRPGVELNLGAVGKGYAVGCIAHSLRQSGVTEALVSAGDSSVEAVGAPAGGWPIALRGQEGRARLWLRRGAVATSGAGEQGFEHNGVRLGHVLDPRTGWPARGVARVTVVAPDAADADALATAMYVGGPALAERYLATHDEVLVVFTLDGAAAPRIMGRASGATVEA